MASDTAISWQPSELVSPSSSSSSVSLIVLNQPLSLHNEVYRTLFRRSKHVVAADGGANRLYDLSQSDTSKSKLDPTLVIGDLDSLLPSVRSHYAAKGIKIIQDHDQYSTDFGKAHSWLRSQQSSPDSAQDIVVLGGIGGRIDQGLSVLHHLYMFQNHENYSQGKIYLISSESITFLLKSGRHRIEVKDDKKFESECRKVKWGLGKHVGIVPMKEASIITTKGLEWDVEDWKTEFGGLMSTSNWVKEEWVEVQTSKDVLFTIDLVIDEDVET